MVEETKKDFTPILVAEGAERKADPNARVTFDEYELAEYDKTRGQCMKIDDPKTPYEEEQEEIARLAEQENEMVDEVVKSSLELANENRNKNASGMEKADILKQINGEF